MHKKTAILSLLILVVHAALLCRCSLENLSGGGTEDVNTMVVIGSVFNPDNSPASSAQVLLIPAEFDPVRDARSVILTDTTDATGEYRFSVGKPGAYTAQIVQITSRTRAIMAHRAVQGDTTFFPPAGLSKPGVVKVAVQSNADGYLYIPGTTVFAYTENSAGFVTIDSVPAGMAADISYSTTNTAVSTVLRYSVQVTSGDTTVVWNSGWNYCRTCILNTSSSGAGVAGDVTDFPVLVRLTADNFDFIQAKNKGEDIRFTKSNNTFLPYEIVRWDAANQQAEIWVKVDTLRGNDSLQSLVMYWGNPGVSAGSDPSAVFDTAKGFVGVWHMENNSGAIVPDATANGNAGTALSTAAVTGAIGTAQAFNGSTSLVRVSGPAADRLNFPENGAFSVSAWVRTNVLDSLFHGIVYKSNFQYGLQMRPKNRWEFVTFSDQARWEMSRAPCTDESWHFLAGVRSGTRQYLFVDGACIDSSPTFQQSTLARAENQPLEIGHCPDGGDDPDRYFNGAIDEVRIAGRAHGADWIKLCFMNQKERDALVRWQRTGDASRE